jgi:hypothetical protein
MHYSVFRKIRLPLRMICVRSVFYMTQMIEGMFLKTVVKSVASWCGFFCRHYMDVQ